MTSLMTMLYNAPAASSAASTAAREASDAGMIGRRTSGWNQVRTRDSAYLTGAGEASENSALCSGNSRSCSARARVQRSEEHTSELQSLMRISYAVLRDKRKNTKRTETSRQSIRRIRDKNECAA